jgi:outer membrane receptor protein involved in Fe transport
VPGRNLDLYAADLERIEVLTGPQGTLFGAGAQAGVLRFITNKPQLGESSSKVSAGFATTEDGGDGYNVEAVANIPMGDAMALRLVAYQDHRGGYIDNVFSTFTRRPTDLGFANRTDPDGIGPRPAVVPADSVVIDNADIVEDDINEVDYVGARAGLKWQVSDDWDALLSVAYQRIDVEGVFYQLPTGSDGQDLGPLETTIFNKGYTDEEFITTALTVNGKVGPLDFVYAGGYLTRDSDVANDYTNYARGVWGTYYQCTGFSGASVDKCYSPSSVWFDTAENTNTSHEIRLSSPNDWRMRFVGGLFYEDRSLEATTDWFYKSVPECPDSGVSTGSCFLYLDPRAAPKFQSATLNNPNRRGRNVGFFNDFTRDYTQFAAFTSLDFDILENLTLTLGTRYYDIDNSFRGANMGSFYCKVYGTGETGPCTGDLYGYGDAVAPYGTNVDEQPDNTNKVDGFRSRANLTWRVTDDILFYGTWSEGYRPGGFNRGSACGLRDPATNQFQWCFPTSYDSDDLTNYELGWKTVFADGRVQFNGAIYREKWEDAQTILFAPQLGFPNLTANLNGPEYEVDGIEVNLAFAPVDGLTIVAAASYNKGELKNSPQVTNNIPGHPNFGQPVTESCLSYDTATSTCNNVVSVEDIYGETGTELANSPPLQFNIRARYEWVRGDYAPYVGAAVQYQDSSFSSAINNNRFEMPSWTTFDLAAGVSRDAWNAELYAVNVSNEDASMFSTAAQFILAEVPIRPRTIGLRFGYQFGGN